MAGVLKAPFPYFGGKSTVARQVWEYFGDCPNYCEPFAGSLAVLLYRPHWPWEGRRTETANDLDGWLANFWRAIKHDPEAVAAHADWPVSELDLHARGDWLFYRPDAADFVERLRADPDYYCARSAGWWVWGQCCWIGSGWGPRQLPHLGDAGRGVNRQLPHLGNAGQGVNRQHQELLNYFAALADRLRDVRVCCGNWSRVCGPSVTFKHGLTAVFLDPPYAHGERADNLYATDTDVFADVRRWCLENGGNKKLRICLCGYAGECHEELEAHGWESVAWKAKGGFGSQGNGRGRENSGRERLWFSPACVPQTLPLFGD
jgi:DNA adenine methylase